MEQEGMYAASEEEGLDDGALEEMLQMEQAARDALEYEEAMEAQAEAMREVLLNCFYIPDSSKQCKSHASGTALLD